MNKICTKCTLVKPIDEFAKKCSSKDGRRSECKQCNKIYKLSVIDRTTEYGKSYYKQNRIIIQTKYYENHEQNLLKDAEYRKNNRKSINQKQRDSEYTTKRRKIDIDFKISGNLRNRLRNALKRNQKSGSAVRDLGCSIEFLKQYLENQFIEGMSWDNYGRKPGQWSIDHIIALSTVDLTDREQFLKVAHYTNLRPMWHCDNVSKGAKCA